MGKRAAHFVDPIRGHELTAKKPHHAHAFWCHIPGYHLHRFATERAHRDVEDPHHNQRLPPFLSYYRLWLIRPHHVNYPPPSLLPVWILQRLQWCKVNFGICCYWLQFAQYLFNLWLQETIHCNLWYQWLLTLVRERIFRKISLGSLPYRLQRSMCICLQ